MGHFLDNIYSWKQFLQNNLQLSCYYSPYHWSQGTIYNLQGHSMAFLIYHYLNFSIRNTTYLDGQSFCG
jgi:hypothetical protein